MATVDATTVDAALRDVWRSLRDDGGEAALSRGHAVIGFAFAIGLLTLERRELWERRIATCPGHDDEGGRAWCVYCGDMPSDEESDHAEK